MSKLFRSCRDCGARFEVSTDPALFSNMSCGFCTEQRRKAERTADNNRAALSPDVCPADTLTKFYQEIRGAYFDAKKDFEDPLTSPCKKSRADGRMEAYARAYRILFKRSIVE